MIARDRMLVVSGWILAFPLFFLAAGGGQASGDSDGPASGRSGFVLPRKHETSLTREERRGKGLYEYYCALCHGKTGNADGFNSYNLNPPPAKHTDTTLMATLSDAQIQKIIREGGASMGRSPQMPPWGNVLTEREIADITAFIRTLPSSGAGP